MPSSCTVRAVLAFPPGVSLNTVERELREVVSRAAAETGVSGVTIRRGDHVADSAAAPENTPTVQTAVRSIDRVTGQSPEFYYGHTASDIRYPMQYWDAPTVGFGPRAGAMGEPDEWVDRKEYLETVSALATFLFEFTP
jgi:acetylornithine deacetylase/succinyl-diaminopimelate desuccinylase-like protein